MSIRIVPQQALIDVQKQTGGVEETPLLLYPHLASLYANRAKRFATLANDHPFCDYLNFASTLADAQQKTIDAMPLICDLRSHIDSAAKQNKAPLDCRTFVRDNAWIERLFSLIDILLQDESLNHLVKSTLNSLRKAPENELNTLADALLTHDLSTVSSNNALFIWTALSIYWAQLAAQLQKISVAKVERGEHRQFCPVCHSAPVASMVHIGTNAGTRYLHCSLCETEWYMTRVKCTNCEDMSELTYLSLDEEKAIVKAECCAHCNSYLKVIYQENDAHADVVADDLAALILAAKVEDEGYSCSGINPYLFPSGE